MNQLSMTAADQINSVRHGVHLEHVGQNKWRLTGNRATVHVTREDRHLSKEMRATLHSRARTYPQWVVRATEIDEGSPFATAGEALSNAYEKAGELSLEL